jgi:hypothetical protein
LPLVGAVLVVVVIAAAYFLFLRPATPASADVGTKMMDEGRQHVTEGSPIHYVNKPPSSGPHYPSPKDWGVYTEPIEPGYFVHNLEHGGVDFLYDCPSGCPDIVSQLENADKTFPVDKYGEIKLVVTPYSGLPNGATVAALAWDYQLLLTKADFSIDKLLAFYNAHVDKGPEDIP